MGLYSDPPPARTFSQDKPTLLVCWWCTSFAATVIFLRVCGRYIRTEKLFKEDWLALVCLVPLCIRMGLVHVVLLYGTNNAVEPAHGWSADELNQRRIGSQLVLASRVFYAATLWMLKLTITEFFKRLIIQIWKRSYEITLQCIRWVLLFTFICVVIADISECQPIAHYWQVSPDPGPQCRQGFAQLLTMGICSVVTDLLLVVFPIPIIVLSQMGPKRKFQLVLLFGLSMVTVAFSLYRMPNIINRKGQQQYRSVWASVEILAATGVANALVLGSFVRDRGVKKVKWKYGSTTDSVERSTTRRETFTQHWGSDEDLARDLGIGVDPTLRTSDHAGPRVAPMATPAIVADGMMSPQEIDRAWQFPSKSDDGMDHAHGAPRSPDPSDGPSESVMTPSRQVSFFDVSNLLGDAGSDSKTAPSMASDSGSIMYAPSQESGSNVSPTSTRKGSHALLQDVGGFLRSGPRNPRSPARGGVPGGRGIELQSIPQRGTIQGNHAVAALQDVGGLLSR
ncbi:MAG: hypothetical protein M1818_008374 [Claussenomyces sp. TS43310]|nr:MAG: hypothetical protein M1818_008374 [Claussenomyces sp. TS43310]